MKNKDVEQVLFSEAKIRKSLKEAGEKISSDYRDKNLLIVCVLKGAVMATAELLKNITVPCSIDFIQASSYGEKTSSSGKVVIKKDIGQDLSGCDLLICEDILDSGLTLSKLCDMLSRRNPRSIKIFTMLDKPEGRKVDLKADYFCFKAPDAFLVGYGLDYAEKYRNLPYIGILKKSVYENK
ncbi:MAG: hypoxanthine phosphoribosyltransferase [Clostridia bacterium]|nr:hypoxanthine phosphoribosyltransferase [Clostridia bacterium]